LIVADEASPRPENASLPLAPPLPRTPSPRKTTGAASGQATF